MLTCWTLSRSMDPLEHVPALFNPQSKTVALHNSFVSANLYDTMGSEEYVQLRVLRFAACLARALAFVRCAKLQPQLSKRELLSVLLLAGRSGVSRRVADRVHSRNQAAHAMWERRNCDADARPDAPTDTPFLVVGLKQDLRDESDEHCESAVEFEEGKAFAKEMVRRSREPHAERESVDETRRACAGRDRILRVLFARHRRHRRSVCSGVSSGPVLVLHQATAKEAAVLRAVN